MIPKRRIAKIGMIVLCLMAMRFTWYPMNVQAETITSYRVYGEVGAQETIIEENDINDAKNNEKEVIIVDMTDHNTSWLPQTGTQEEAIFMIIGGSLLGVLFILLATRRNTSQR